ncbi:helix-turn-helix domain-containing protein [Paenibacillus sp. LMG 31458]|uniref:Helix-turn-helix domain-containing protein n=3 Tax=Paenibacillus TaxID=44249 RepID=A0ABX1Z4R3_9BACL|nr:helix-turn-helix transcriptional regulator [Paenibacillus sp. Root444D2]KQX51989.1 transcriptional regulator [Paenibacillus sp. Root444D2]KRE50988.1 transcriptional regulator [Paenibacillus sp. Soil724D2]NOU70910.1 helix-turn-helix domain-containing protein [Paenibacillus phytorum]NOU87824.1 helix-turn-helix domain-containing protein [Paenibacillus germinis]
MIGQNISSIRKQRGYTLSELSERTGISKSYLSNIERNLKQNPSIHVMEKIALVLKVDLKTLLKIAADVETSQQLDQEWMDFISDLKQSGIDKERIHEFKILIEFMKWNNEKIK